MKKLFALLMLTPCLMVATNEQCPVQKAFMAEGFTKEFTEGFIAGAIATVGVDFVRTYILPEMNQLWPKYGICRDRLTGEISVAAALLGIAAFKEWYATAATSCMGSLATRLCGVIVGAAVAKVIRKRVAVHIG